MGRAARGAVPRRLRRGEDHGRLQRDQARRRRVRPVRGYRGGDMAGHAAQHYVCSNSESERIFLTSTSNIF